MSVDIARVRLRNQQIERPQFRSAGELVAHMGAVQAQDYPGGKWGVGLRVRSATDASIERAIASRKIVRTWPMRGTLHFVAAEDVRWMLRLLTPRVVRLTASRYRQLELDDRGLAEARKVIVKALEGGQGVRRTKLLALLRASGIETKDNRGGHIFGRLAMEGTIVFGPHEGKQPTFVLLEEWLPPARVLDGEEALAELALRYFGSHGPATVADLSWWSGLTMREAKLGIEGAKDRLVEEGGYWAGLGPGSRAKALQPRRGKPSAYLLPPFDEYAVAYRDRSAIVPTEFAKAATSGGIFAPIVVIDGQVVGSWKRTLVRDGVEVVVAPFGELDSAERKAVEAAAGRYARFLGVPLAGVSLSR